VGGVGMITKADHPVFEDSLVQGDIFSAMIIKILVTDSDTHLK
jgi:hypothetical protein